MKLETTLIQNVKPNPKNPRVIRDDKFKKLVQSIKDFPQMLDIRPIVVDNEGFILGGNMRYKACIEAGLKEITIIKADNLTEEQKLEFIIKDNANFGDWDWQMINSEDTWNPELLESWGIDYFQLPTEADYSILDDKDDSDNDLDDKVDNMKSGVRKAIQIEFDSKDYDKAQILVKQFRDKNLYVGGILIEALENKK